MLPTKAVVLVIWGIVLGTVSAKLTSEIYRDLEEALEELVHEAEKADELKDDEDEIDINSRMNRREGKTLAEAAIAEANDLLEEEFVRRNRFFNEGIDTLPGSGPMTALNDIHYGSEAEHEENRTLISLFAARILLEDDDNDFHTLEDLLNNKGVKEAFSDKAGSCTNKNKPIIYFNCSEADSVFRTINGSCNNIDNPRWGESFTPQIRLLDADYENGLDAPRIHGVNGALLNSSRTVSTAVLRNISDTETPDDQMRSVMAMAWGQFLDHDITETPLTKGRLDSDVRCCGLNETRETQCFTIAIDANDHRFNRNCMELVRSEATLFNPCVPGVRDQLNVVTAFIDGSQVYGSENELAERLRTKTNGAMKVVNVAGTKVLPENDDSACELDGSTGKHCLLAGDVRVNENPFLASLHTAFVLYHNKLAERFHNADDSLSDEDIYQMTRKIIGAIMQRVTYSEWLPDVLGEDAMDEHKLTLKGKDRYRKNTNPTIQLPFSSAAMRFGHSMVVDLLRLLNAQFETENQFNLADVFFRPNLLFNQTQVSELVRWIFTFPSKQGDRLLADDIGDFLFGDLDLGALNIQRGREHGLPSYTEYRSLCNLPVPQNFDELEDHTEEVQRLLKETYEDVRDIDLFAGALSENKCAPDANVGNTFACLLGMQFRALKEGDRFFHERDLPEGFNEDQLDNIKNVRLSKVMCEVFGITEIPRNIFRMTTANQFQKCSNLEDIDVNLWL